MDQKVKKGGKKRSVIEILRIEKYIFLILLFKSFKQKQYTDKKICKICLQYNFIPRIRIYKLILNTKRIIFYRTNRQIS